MFPQNPLRCPHKILDYHWITDKYAELFCIACGETVSITDSSDDKVVSGKPRPLTKKEKEELR